MKQLIYTLLFFTTILIGSACLPTGGNITTANDSINYLIPKGAHYATPRLNQSHSGISRVTYYIQFENNCKYKLNTIDSNDINKAYGYSYGLHQSNSTRLGWNWKSDTLMLYNYSYFSGTRVSRKIGNFATQKPIYVDQKLSGDTSWITLVQNNKASSRFVVGKGTTKQTGYILYPYFGGTSVAPNAMNIKVWGVKTY